MAMEPVYLDSFYYNEADLAIRGWTKVESIATDITMAADGWIVFAAGSGTNYILRPLGANYASLSLCFRVKLTRSTANGEYLFQLDDTVTAQLRLHATSTSGTLELRRNTTTIITATNAIPDDLEHHIELRFKIADSGGFAHLYVDGVEVGGGFTGDTQASASNAYVSRMILNYASSAAFTCSYGSLSIWQDDAAGDATQVGPHYVGRLTPDGDGNYEDWTTSTGTDSYALVDETDNDGDSTYIEATTVADQTTFTLGAPDAAAGTLLGVQGVLIARKTDANTREVSQLLRVGSTDANGPTHTLTSSYAAYYYPTVDKPGGGTLVVSDLTNAELGVEVET